MGYPMGWYWYDTVPRKRYGIAHGPSGRLSLSRLARCLDWLRLPLVPHHIPYHLEWDWDGMRQSDPIPYRGMVKT